MNLSDITGKWEAMYVEVRSVGDLYLVATQRPDPCLAQKVEVVDKAGKSGTITVYSKDETFAVEKDELGLIKYRIRKRGSFEGYPLESKQLNIGDKLMKAPQKPQIQKDLPPEGTQLAICYQVVDLGTHKKNYKDYPAKDVRLLKLGWELPKCRHQFESPDGKKIDKPFAMWEDYNFTTYNKGDLAKKIIIPWIGRCPDDFDFETLIRRGCYLNISYNVGTNKLTYANVNTAMALPPDTEVPPMFNDPQFYSITGHGREFPAWLLEEKMSFLKEKIESCQEFAQIDHAASVIEASGLEGLPEGQTEDDIPF